MGVLADRLDSLVLSVHSPDEQIGATLSHRRHVELRFAPGAYQRYQERSLAYQLANLAAAVWVEYVREYRRAFSDATGAPFRESLVRGSMRHRLYQEQAELEAEGTAASGWVTVRSQGLRHWSVAIRPGALGALTEQEFADAVVEAFQALRIDFFQRAHRLRDRYFDLELPGRGR